MTQQHNLIIPTGASIGSIAAENVGKFLKEAFVAHLAMRSLVDLETPKMVLVGRTGSGKSAILLEIEKSNPDSSRRIEANDVAMDHLFNTNIVAWLTQNDFHIDKFLDVIWNHVFIKTTV
jgi:ABC-type transport system involved in cytochrome bd biosynthesis fused ATPase/permease subunit